MESRVRLIVRRRGGAAAFGERERGARVDLDRRATRIKREKQQATKPVPVINGKTRFPISGVKYLFK
ncbi:MULTISPECIES: hypothetical protein [Burkholderia]|uniref:hypothetical protein n=1 Tax=Burkholderia TaxID=32008 RepID=UPI0012E336E0|nr:MULTISPECIES: hypothetical protein [Burkholderia]